ncbi:MAG: HupE/UreJ family protein [Aquabacterium sp.]|jgi:urease accessory protein|uniref:HupE/UreJ family protein n=1 Tax=Aquabacterium sp. TaxID=1872578 RepID=UPI003BAF3DA3
MRKTSIRRTIMATSATALGLASTAVLAHTGDLGHAHGADAATSFLQGALHPLTGLDHLAAMVSVGLWSALTTDKRNSNSNARSVWTAPAAFAVTLLIGALLGLGGLSLPGIEPMIAASLLVMGLLVCTRTALPPLAGGALVAVFALFHGLAHGAELAGGHAAAALAGMVLSTAALHAAGIALGLLLRDQGPAATGRWAPRAAGLVVAVFGTTLLTPAIASVF